MLMKAEERQEEHRKRMSVSGQALETPPPYPVALVHSDYTYTIFDPMWKNIGNHLKKSQEQKNNERKRRREERESVDSENDQESSSAAGSENGQVPHPPPTSPLQPPPPKKKTHGRPPAPLSMSVNSFEGYLNSIVSVGRIDIMTLRAAAKRYEAFCALRKKNFSDALFDLPEHEFNAIGAIYERWIREYSYEYKSEEFFFSILYNNETTEPTNMWRGWTPESRKRLEEVGAPEEEEEHSQPQ